MYEMDRQAQDGNRGDHPELPETGTTAEWVQRELGFEPDAAQKRVLNTDSRRVLLNCTRQWGKSTTTAAKAVHHAHTQPERLTLAVGPSARGRAERACARRRVSGADWDCRGRGSGTTRCRWWFGKPGRSGCVAGEGE